MYINLGSKVEKTKGSLAIHSQKSAALPVDTFPASFAKTSQYIVNQKLTTHADQ